jgi:hypothetical protein
VTRGSVNYHRHSTGRQAYRIDADGVVGRLASPEHVVAEVPLHDVRDDAHATSFPTDGIGFVVAPSAETLTEPGWERRYEAEIQALLMHELGAEEVRVFDHTLRVDDPAGLRRPARNVHTDFSPHGARARLATLLGEEQAAAWDAGHFAFVNVWRPVSDVIRTAPLGFVRPRSVRPTDWVTLDLVYPDRVGQIMGLVGNPEHEWLYRSAMTKDEVVFFNVYDNRGRPPVAHSAIDLVDADEPSTRKSLETRTLIRYRT